MNNLFKVKISKKEICKGLLIVGIIVGALIYHKIEMDNLKASYSAKILTLENLNSKAQEDYITYKVMFETADKQITQYKNERDSAVQKYQYLTEQIKYSKLNDRKISRGSGYEDRNLKVNPIITIDEMNQYIKDTAPKDSPFIGRGEDFLKASFINNIDPRYIFAHASVESKYGKSDLALNKGNYFGINAVNDDPNKAYNMGDSLATGIEKGAEWIADNYINNGYSTLNKMVNRGYAVNDDGSPNIGWVNQISYIASRFKINI